MIPFTSPHVVWLREGRAGGARLDLRVDRAALGGLEAERAARRRRSTSTSRPAATPSALPGDGSAIANVPSGFASTRQSADGLAPPAGATVFSAPRGHEVAVAPVEEVAAERGGLHAERLGGPGRSGRGAVAARRLGHEARPGERSA